MANTRVLAALLGLIVCGTAFAASPYATIHYAEGSTFILLRGGQSRTVDVNAAGTFGMVIQPGDIIQTSGGTFLEIFINPVSASVQIAENTSFRCDADGTGTKSSGELYYGRVRAKVAKLAGSSSYRISSPSLVAGVRGTDFGCDVIALRPSKSAKVPAASTPILNRVFCFEGSVLVSEPLPGPPEPGAQADGAVELKTVLIGANEMVEKVVAEDASSVRANAPDQPLQKTKVSDEVNAFWSARPVVGHPEAPLPGETEGRLVGRFRVTDKSWPAGRTEKALARNLRVPSLAAAALVTLGTASCAGAAALGVQMPREEHLIYAGYGAGWMMIGSGTLLALVSSSLQ